jgi:hypothetical protein
MRKTGKGIARAEQNGGLFQRHGDNCEWQEAKDGETMFNGGRSLDEASILNEHVGAR